MHDRELAEQYNIHVFDALIISCGLVVPTVDDVKKDQKIAKSRAMLCYGTPTLTPSQCTISLNYITFI